MREKRIFDLSVTIIALPLWLPVLALCGLLILLCDGSPIFYRSVRRTHRKKSYRVIKFRTMLRNAEKILNRETVPLVDSCFLNIPTDSPAYTWIGKKIERMSLTELPQLFHVLLGTMSLIGSRPLPENVVTALRVKFPFTEDRFLAGAGMTGPAQLVGRHRLTDLDRLALEIDYSLLCNLNYSARLDFLILFYTVAVPLGWRQAFSAAEARTLMLKFVSPKDNLGKHTDSRKYLRFQGRRNRKIPVYCNSEQFWLKSISYAGVTLKGNQPLSLGQVLTLSPSLAESNVLTGEVIWNRSLDSSPVAFEIGVKFDLARLPGDFIVGLMQSQYMPISQDRKPGQGDKRVKSVGKAVDSISAQ